ncbi:hypothetical protein TQ32_06825 [Pyrococcus kukulkanii]|uniref:Polymerase nucleotidyl transferase domain-containing protein n=2 Tax=Pyrococcus kukulkanii TaxID=1609559 RepID=A0A127BA47_9EURY|nr:hypothetical protein TQ32_06825 [Pyrococcus kukulkanii]
MMNREVIIKLQKFAEELKSMLGDDLVAVIIFGSVLKSKNFDDVDVLVIAKNPQKYMEKIRGIRLKYRKEVGRFIDLNIISPENLISPLFTPLLHLEKFCTLPANGML